MENGIFGKSGVYLVCIRESIKMFITKAFFLICEIESPIWHLQKPHHGHQLSKAVIFHYYKHLFPLTFSAVYFRCCFSVVSYKWIVSFCCSRFSPVVVLGWCFSIHILLSKFVQTNYGDIKHKMNSKSLFNVLIFHEVKT